MSVSSQQTLLQDSKSCANFQPDFRPWRPFETSDWVEGGISLKADGAMSWNGHEPHAVVENRQRYLASHGLDWRKCVAADQVHGSRVHVAIPADAGRGMTSRDTRIPATDALITHEPGLVLTTLHADCAPIALADADRRVIALVHAGWRGVLAHLPRLVIEKMQTDFGCHPSRMYVSVGPMISALTYPVGKDVAEKFAVEHGEDVILRMPAGRVHLDLFVAILNDLWSAGIAREALSPRPPCTAANPQCASYRRDGPPVPSMLAWLRMVPENAKGSA